MKKTLWKLIATISVNLTLNVSASWLYDVAKKTSWPDPKLLPFQFGALMALCELATLLIALRIIRHGFLDGVDTLSKLIHQFVHRARDLVIVVQGDRPVSSSEHRAASSAVQCDGRLQALLQVVVAAFTFLVPRGTKVFAALRERRPDEHFHTIARIGECRHEREDTSEPLSLESPMVKELHDAYCSSKDCAILTGPGMPNWTAMFNDRYGEDKAVLMGAVFSKTWNPVTRKFPMGQRRLEWILCVAADRPEAFTRARHFELLKAFNDIFGIVLNLLVRVPQPDQVGNETLDSSGAAPNTTKPPRNE